MRRLLCAMCVCLLCVSATPQAFSDDQPKPRDPGAGPDVQDVIFLGKSRPVMVRMHLLADGKPFSQSWDNYLQKLFKHADVDGNGSLDKKEVKLLPPATTMQNLIRGNFYSFNNVPLLSIAQLDSDNDDKVTIEEIKAYYADKAQVSAMQIISGNPYGYSQPAGNTYTSALTKYLGDKDGKIVLKNLPRELADALVTRLDGDDDETVSAAELIAGMPQQARVPPPPVEGGGVAILPATRTVNLGDSSFMLVPKEAGPGRLTERLTLSKELLKRYDKDNSTKLTRDEIGLDAESFKKLDRNEDNLLEAVELMRYFIVSPDVELNANLGQRGEKPAIELTPGSKANLASKINQASQEALMLSLSTLQMELRTGATINVYGRNFEQLNAYFTRIFEMVDAKKKGFIDMKEDTKNPQFQYMKNFLEMCDRDGNGKVMRKEFDDTIKLQNQAFGTTFTISVNESGRGLFELLDLNRDGRLSIRELRKAKDALGAYDLNGDGMISEEEVPVQISLSVSMGSTPDFTRGRGGFNPGMQQPRPTQTAGPKWFRKMDRNNDGDVSRREFLGPPEAFKKLDLDDDGFISREEAEKAEATYRTKK